MTLIERSFQERIILVGVALGGKSYEEVESDLDELALLVDTAGALVVGRVIQRRDRPDPATFVGAGKAEEIHQLSEVLDVDTVVFDEELTPAQQRNLEKIFGRTAIDRTAVILDVFAQNASTPEGKAQVELALLSYRLPRLRGKGKALSQQVGRIGTRGPGETKLEEDRRRLLERMSALRRELKAIQSTRQLQRRSRKRSRGATVSLVGYTNAGKSTLMNQLTNAGVLAEDRLFATLDPRTRRLSLPGGESITLTDTVGFIKKLPHQLIESFRSTLEVISEADLLIHVVDGSSLNALEQMKAVREVLDEIGAGKVEEVVAINKVDLLESSEHIQKVVPGAVLVSALTGQGVHELLSEISGRLRRRAVLKEISVPLQHGELLAFLHREGEILSERIDEDGINVLVRLEPASLGLLEKMLSEVDER
ncbi:GTP-binding protein HflX [Ferrithrix thermotolerans DSM 19514]|uniref:GTPase HflX n=1 Tax=Ferrithrix thermotolerans DSM 19514 TaxID=1121881 RepID=A0A1M4TQC8_9ACTN|nr:GTPase HflX [Ferrithrix thermotolerans]SHE46719.1 GTP-binding protein HflX [Ferrithrix thermotolerans DSM 19514]